LNKIYIIPLILITFNLLFASNGLTEYSKLSKEYHHFFEKERTRDKWLELIKKFEVHGNKYKKEDISAKSFYNVATLSYKIYKISHRQSDLNKSLKNYKELCLNYKNSSLSDDSCVFLYKFFFKKTKNYEKSKFYAKYLLDNHKDGDNFKETLKFVKKNFPSILKKDNNKKILNKKSNRIVDIEFYNEKLIIKSKSKYNETAKLGEVKVDGELVKVFIDLKKESVLHLKPIKINFIVDKVRFGQYKKDTARIVIDLKKNVKYKILDRGKTLVISFKNDKKKKDEIVPKEIIKVKKQKTSDKKEKENNINVTKLVLKPNSDTDRENNKKEKKKKYIIIIDAGHGGKDPGAQSKDKKIYEKDVTLKVALKLAKKLRKNKKYKVILTRKTDKFLTLDQRTDIANDNNGDIFISLHINALPNKKFYGIETFYLNIAADNYSKRLEAVENAENQKKITDLQFILADLLKKANTKESIDLADYIQSSLIFNLRRKYKRIKNLGVKNAMFYVLLDTKMPSVLVELGFISNKSELKNLTNNQYEERLADSIVKGVNKFFLKYKKRK